MLLRFTNQPLFEVNFISERVHELRSHPIFGSDAH
jgi:hypothetical protein